MVKRCRRNPVGAPTNTAEQHSDTATAQATAEQDKELPQQARSTAARHAQQQAGSQAINHQNSLNNKSNYCRYSLLLPGGGARGERTTKLGEQQGHRKRAIASTESGDFEALVILGFAVGLTFTRNAKHVRPGNGRP